MRTLRGRGAKEKPAAKETGPVPTPERDTSSEGDDSDVCEGDSDLRPEVSALRPEVSMGQECGEVTQDRKTESARRPKLSIGESLGDKARAAEVTQSSDPDLHGSETQLVQILLQAVDFLASPVLVTFIEFFEEVTRNVDESKKVDVFYIRGISDNEASGRNGSIRQTQHEFSKACGEVKGESLTCEIPTGNIASKRAEIQFLKNKREEMFAAIITTLTLSVCAVGVNAGTVLIQSPGVVKVREGGTVQIQCDLQSDNVDYTVDKYDVHWYDSHSKLTGHHNILGLTSTGHIYRSWRFSDRFQLSRNVTTNSYSLTISKVKVTDPKLYICGIWGSVFGKGTQLNVTSADVPVLVQSPSIQRVTEGHMVWLCCTMRNARLEDTDVHWYRKLPGQDMEWVLTHSAGGRSEWGRGFTWRFLPYRDTSNSSFTLTVTDVVHSDSAVYYCRVWGDIHGNGTQLIVTNPADDPVLVQDPPISKVPEGVTVQLHCALYNASVNVTDVHWYHQRPGNKSEWALSHFVNDSVSRSGYISDRFQSYRNVVSNSYILTISNTSISDTAVYNCRVWSYIYGGGTQLNVTGAVIPVLIQSPSIQRVTEGHMAWLCCTMRNARLEDTDVHWYRKLLGQDMEWVLTHRAGGRAKWGRGFSERFQSDRDTSNSSFTLTVTDVVHSDSADYYCRVWGDIDGNGTQLIVTNPADDPVLVQDPPISKVPEGVTVQLHCALYNASVTVTDVHWYHQRPGNKSEWALSHFVNDSVSRSGYISDRFQSYRNVVNNSYILAISNTSISDTAVYNCSVWSYIYGGGTQLNVTEADYGWSWKVLASILAGILVLVLLFCILVTTICYVKKQACFQQRLKPEGCSTEYQETVYATVTAETEVNTQAATNVTASEQSEIFYADIQFLRQNAAPRVKVIEETTEYAVIKRT
ncbi:uncharacterized protein [Mobula birostris]|uniref:uncharacterized protein n=1 Tax=Mobula birostris TaxID=1983395 RepID=UPI003B2866DF